jgi:folylpolyglutamate synthase
VCIIIITMSSPSSSGEEEEEPSYVNCLRALFSPLHQATTKAEIAKSAARRVHTITDMRRYWNCLEKNNVLQLKLPKRIIHITGTKGKGSTACMCEAVLRAHGYSTGLFTSPHLIDIRERIRWNGKPVHPNIFARNYWTIRKALETLLLPEEEELPRLPGYFRYLTLMAYLTFAELKVDVMIIEVGMGGRYDATNFMDVVVAKTDDNMDAEAVKVACGVTLLDLDHTRILGNTLEQIAWEKGGIFAIYDKASTTNVSPRPMEEEEGDESSNGIASSMEKGDGKGGNDSGASFFILNSNQPGVLGVFQQCARIEGHGTVLKPVDAEGLELQKYLGGEPLGLAGRHQYGNANLAVHLCQAVTKSDTIRIENATTLRALQGASWPARCQTVEQGQRTFRLDGAHTPQSLGATMEWFTTTQQQQQQTFRPDIVLVFNTSHERNPVELLRLLQPAGFQKVYFAKSDSSRPSPVNVPTAKELLEANGIPMNPNIEIPDEPTWQETLGVVWKHLEEEKEPSNNNSCGNQESRGQVLKCNMTASQVLVDLSGHASLEVLVTGSLYLVGSFLTAIDWEEQSSPDMML